MRRTILVLLLVGGACDDAPAVPAAQAQSDTPSTLSPAPSRLSPPVQGIAPVAPSTSPPSQLSPPVQGAAARPTASDGGTLDGGTIDAGGLRRDGGFPDGGPRRPMAGL